MYGPLPRLAWKAFLLGTCWAATPQLTAQTPTPRGIYDSTYVKDYSRQITGRLYFSTKYNKLDLGGPDGGKSLTFRPNNRVNFGVGLSYRTLTLNVGVGVPGLNKDQDRRGKTKYLDAQANIYTKRWATNLFLQRFHGYYISTYAPQELGWDQATAYPTRPDLMQYNLGVSTVHIVNNDRFSYRAAFNQDAWQRRSQGSLLIGGYITYFHLHADSSLVPSSLSTLYVPDLHLVRGSFLDAGPSVGYAYTLVIRKHLFLTGSLVVGGGLSVQEATINSPEARRERRNSAGLGWHGQVRAALGYNSDRYFMGLSFNQETIGYLLEAREDFHWSVGNIRLTFAKRFNGHIGFLDHGKHH